jgi:hypothetical protein
MDKVKDRDMTIDCGSLLEKLLYKMSSARGLGLKMS